MQSDFHNGSELGSMVLSRWNFYTLIKLLPCVIEAYSLLRQ